MDGARGETVVCPSCRAVMLHGMRFCRACGYRLGEGVAEYAETRRFATAPPLRPVATASQQAWGGAVAPGTETSALNQIGVFAPVRSEICGRRRRMKWIGWVALGLAISAASGIIPFININRESGSGSVTRRAPQSFFGVSEFEDVDNDGGAFIEAVSRPNSPAEGAGLIGGDIVTSFDGQPVKEARDIRRLLAATPVGKTVEVVFTRDGEIKRTTLTTSSRKDFNSDAFSDRPEGAGFLGVDDLERVSVPGTKIHGVRLGEVARNRPADIAGLKEGDIVTEFNGNPIRTSQELGSRIDEAAPGSVIPVVVIRGGERVEIPVKMGREN